MRLEHLAAQGENLRNGPAGLVVNIGGFHARGFKQDWLVANPGVGGLEAFPVEDIQIGIFLIPRFKVLGADEIVGVVVHGRAILAIKAGLKTIRSEKAVRRSFCSRLAVCVQRGADGVGAQQRIGGVRHQVGLGGNIGHVIRQHKIHAGKITAKLRLAVTDEHAVALADAVLRQNFARVGVDDNQVNLWNAVQRVENPAEQGLAGKQTEVFARNPCAVRLHWQQGDDIELFIIHGAVRF